MLAGKDCFKGGPASNRQHLREALHVPPGLRARVVHHRSSTFFHLLLISPPKGKNGAPLWPSGPEAYTCRAGLSQVLPVTGWPSRVSSGPSIFRSPGQAGPHQPRVVLDLLIASCPPAIVSRLSDDLELVLARTAVLSGPVSFSPVGRAVPH